MVVSGFAMKKLDRNAGPADGKAGGSARVDQQAVGKKIPSSPMAKQGGKNGGEVSGTSDTQKLYTSDWIDCVLHITVLL